jgi:tetratricopeptide (TPR) repeat protein
MNLNASLCALLISAVALLSVPAASQTVRPAESLKRSGAAKVLLRQYDGAIADFTKAIELNHPQLGDIYLRRAGAFFGKKDYDRAWADATKALPLLSAPAEAFRLRGEIALMQDRRDVAIAELSKALELFPGDTVSLTNRAAARDELGDKDGALADLTKAIEAAPGMSFLYIRRANIYRQKGDKAAGFRDLNKAVELAAGLPGPYTSRGHAYMLDDNYAAALADFKKALSINSGWVDAYHYLGHLHHGKAEFGPAIEAFTNAIRLEPDAAYYLDRAEVYRDKFELDRSREDLVKGLKLDPDNADIKRALAYVDLMVGGAPTAITAAEELLAKHGAKGKGHYAIVIGYLGYLNEHRQADGKAFLKKWVPLIETGTFPDKLVRLLDGQLTAAQLLAAAKDDIQRTEARAIIGTDAAFRGKEAIAKPHLNWLRTKGMQGNWLYTLGDVVYKNYYTGQAAEPMGE